MKKIRVEPYVERPAARKAFLLTRKWLVFRRDGGEEPSRARVRSHIENNFRSVTPEQTEDILQELGL